MSNEGFGKVSCEHCGQHIEFPLEAAGMKVACPTCAQETTLLAEIPIQAEEAEEITDEELQAALQGVVKPRRISIFYQAGLMLVAIFMILLPLAYLAFASFAAYCVYWYAVHGLVIFSKVSGGSHMTILKLIVYVGPIVGGAVAVFFMFKPLLAGRPEEAEPIELEPARHPRLYHLIARVSNLLQVSMPKRIFLDCSLNASAGFQRGWSSLLGNDLVMTLGLPLAAGMNARQFAAVIAHELGHCTQAFAMRLSYIIDSIDRWFMRVVYERDTWDQAVDEWAGSVEDWRMSLLVGCVRLSVWISRKVLTVFMLAGHVASCFLSRQMEYHADGCAMAVAGSAGLESLLIRLREQSVVESKAYKGLHNIWEKRHQLPASLPEYFREFEKHLPAGFHDKTHQTLLNETAGLFATHPTDCQRIQKARKQGQEGIFALEKPASALFNDFPATSQEVTDLHYRQTLNLAIVSSILKPASAFFQEERH
jgi:Zn-dependent protease with chaperone function